MIIIRKAVSGDAEATISININTWISAYKGIINDDTLDGLADNKENRIEKFKAEFGTREVRGNLIEYIVAIDDSIDGQPVIGFASYGVSRDESFLNVDDYFEIYALYVSEEHQNRGVGRKLATYVMDQMKGNEDDKRLLIWTLEKNRSRSFYEKLGGKVQFDKEIKINGQSLNEVGYVF